MQIAQAKDYYQAGVITGFMVTKDPMGAGWLLGLTGPGQHWMLETKVGGNRVFASLDTLVGVVEKIAGRVTGMHVYP